MTPIRENLFSEQTPRALNMVSNFTLARDPIWNQVQAESPPYIKDLGNTEPETPSDDVYFPFDNSTRQREVKTKSEQKTKKEAN